MQLAAQSVTDPEWRACIQGVLEDVGGLRLQAYLNHRAQQGAIIYPPQDRVFAAFELTPLEKVKVVILAQDPYHGEGQAMGFAFSVPDGHKCPPSLANIFREIDTDIGGSSLQGTDLTGWAKQGVLLLNSVLTVEKGRPKAHARAGWEELASHAISRVSERRDGVVFLLWGASARSCRDLIDEDRHLVLCAPHPSPLSAHRGFFGCRHFSTANAYLQAAGRKRIQW